MMNRIFTILCLALAVATGTPAAAQNACNLIAPKNFSAKVNTSFITLKWKAVNNALGYQLQIFKIVQTGTTEPDTVLQYGVFLSQQQTSFVYDEVTGGQKYLAKIRTVCVNQTPSAATSSVAYRGIIIEDVVYMVAPGCGMTNCDCPLNTLLYNARRNTGQTRTFNWLTSPDRQTYKLVIRNGRPGLAAQRSEFKIARDLCVDGYSFKTCLNNTYTLNLMGTDSLGVFGPGGSSLKASIAMTNTSFTVRSFDSLLVRVTLCDTCDACGPAGGNLLGTTEMLLQEEISEEENSETTAQSIQYSVYPNPSAGDKISLHFISSQAVENTSVSVLNVEGKWVAQLFIDENLPEGPSEYHLNVEQVLPAGTYYIQLQTPYGTTSIPWIVR